MKRDPDTAVVSWTTPSGRIYTTEPKDWLAAARDLDHLTTTNTTAPAAGEDDATEPSSIGPSTAAFDDPGAEVTNDGASVGDGANAAGEDVMGDHDASGPDEQAVGGGEDGTIPVAQQELDDCIALLDNPVYELDDDDAWDAHADKLPPLLDSLYPPDTTADSETDGLPPGPDEPPY